MTDESVCYCGHVADEHEPNAHGQPVQCTVEDCRCVQFELNEDEDSDDE